MSVELGMLSRREGEAVYIRSAGAKEGGQTRWLPGGRRKGEGDVMCMQSLHCPQPLLSLRPCPVLSRLVPECISLTSQLLLA